MPSHPHTAHLLSFFTFPPNRPKWQFFIRDPHFCSPSKNFGGGVKTPKPSPGYALACSPAFKTNLAMGFDCSIDCWLFLCLAPARCFTIALCPIFPMQNSFLHIMQYAECCLSTRPFWMHARYFEVQSSEYFEMRFGIGGTMYWAVVGRHAKGRHAYLLQLRSFVTYKFAEGDIFFRF